ncbi:MAG: fumarate hydratase [Deltaproteobacteria bacterium]|nr:MAG: fumarate hydratase [Deltaproteobacteria bacterium]
MREIHTNDIIEALKDLTLHANTELGSDVINAFKKAIKAEESPLGKDVLKSLIENARIAREDGIPICQDTGLAVVFVEIGQEVHVIGGSLKEAINEGVRLGYRNGYLRKSTCDPFTRKNIGDNTPAVIHFDIVEGDSLKITFVPKGGGSENMSRATMLTPAAGIDGIKKFVIDLVDQAGPNPCPPIIVGIGIGGSIEKAALLAKKAILRPVGTTNPDPFLQGLEKDLLEEINRLGIGPEGYGGRVTSLAVHINSMPCHIASLPVAVNIQCHASRHREVEL